MKIRNGFVSNSSSSSYIVRIKNTTEAESVGDMYELSQYDWPQEVIESAKERLMFLESFAEKVSEECEEQDVLSASLTSCKDETSRLKDAIKRLSSKDAGTKIRAMLDCNGVKLIQEDEDLVLTQFTVMHNDFNEGVCDLFKEIILSYMFNTNHKLIFARDSD